jgi:hypothetical protein
MRKNKKYLLLALCAVFAIALLTRTVVSAEDTTVVGTVNDIYQVVTENNEVYEVGENQKGDELVRLVDKKVRVTGTVEESGGAKVIMVTSYEVLGE